MMIFLLLITEMNTNLPLPPIPLPYFFQMNMSKYIIMYLPKDISLLLMKHLKAQLLN